MPFQNRPIHGGRILLVRATGGAERGDWSLLLRDPVLSGRSGLVVDLRRRVSLPTGDTALLIGRDLAGLAPHLAAVGLVAKPGVQFGLARMVDIMAEDGGRAAKSFHDLREAFDWVRARI